VTYTLAFRWNTVSRVWMLDIYDEDMTAALIRGIALVTGCDLLEQFAYMTLGATLMLTVMTIGPGVSPDNIPDFNDLGVDGHLYATMPAPA
jgi:hypothetical protein